MVRMRSPVQIRIAAPKTPENLGFWGFFVAKSCFTVRVKNPDPHRDTHAETAGKDKRAPDGKICLPVRFLRLLKRLYNLSQDAAHSLGGLVLLLPRGVGVGAQGEPGIVVPRHGGHGFDVHAVLEGCGGEGVPLWHNKDKSENPCVATGWRFVLILFPPKTALKRGLREGVKNQGCT